MLVFVLSELKLLQGGGKGMMLMGLADKDELAAAAVINQPEVKIIGKTGAKEQVVKLSGDSCRTTSANVPAAVSTCSRIKPSRIE